MSEKNNDKNNAVKADRLNRNKNIRIFNDANSFKKKMDLYPDFYGHLWLFIKSWKIHELSIKMLIINHSLLSVLLSLLKLIQQFLLPLFKLGLFHSELVKVGHIRTGFSGPGAFHVQIRLPLLDPLGQPPIIFACYHHIFFVMADLFPSVYALALFHLLVFELSELRAELWAISDSNGSLLRPIVFRYFLNYVLHAFSAFELVVGQTIDAFSIRFISKHAIIESCIREQGMEGLL